MDFTDHEAKAIIGQDGDNGGVAAKSGTTRWGRRVRSARSPKPSA